MRYIYILILCFFSSLLYSQGAGIRYVNAVPTTHPNTNIRQSVVVYNVTDGKYYQYQDSLWKDMGIIRVVDSVEQILTQNYSLGEVIYNKTNGASYLVESDTVTGYVTDNIAVIPVDSGYATLQPYNNSYNVEWFGAVGDSITDDAAALQKAASYTDGQTILFNAKDYLVNGTITVKSFTRFQGVPGTKLWREDSAPSTWFECGGTNGVVFDGIHFLSDKIANFQTILDLDGSDNALVQYCQLELLNEPTYGETMHGVLARGAYNINIRFNKTKYCQIKLAGAGAFNKHNWVTDNYMEKPFNFAISSVTNSDVDPDTIMNLYIERNTIVDPMSVGGIFVGADGENAVPPYYVANVYIQDNVIEGLWADPLDITTSMGINFRTGYVTEHIKINGNIIENSRTGNVGNTRGIQFLNGDSLRLLTRDIEISNNYIGNMDLEGIIFGGASDPTATTRGIKLIGNYLSKNRGISMGTGTGIDGSGFWISDNHFDSIRTIGLSIAAHTTIDGIAISENTFSNAMVATADAIVLTTSTANNLMGVKFVNNTIDDSYDDGITFTNTGGATHDILVFGNTNNSATPYIGVSPTTFDNVYSVDGALTGARQMDLNGNSLTFYDNTFGVLPLVRLHSDRNGSGASPRLAILNNDVGYYMGVDGATSLLWIGSGTNEIIKISSAALDNTLVLPSTGGIASGIETPTQRYQFRHTSSFNFYVESTSTSGVPSLNIINGDQNWALQTEGNNNDRFVLEDITGGTTPFIVLKTAPSNSHFINASGYNLFGFSSSQGAYRIQSSGDVIIAGHEALTNTTEPANITDGAQVWAEDVIAGQAELYAQGETGNAEQITGLSRVLKTNQDYTTTTYTAISDLTFNVEAGKTYLIDAIIFVDTIPEGGLKLTINGTATATLYAVGNHGDIFNPAMVLGDDIDQIPSTTSDGFVSEFRGSIVINTAGTLGVQGAQFDAGGGTTTVLAGSYLKLSPSTN